MRTLILTIIDSVQARLPGFWNRLQPVGAKIGLEARINKTGINDPCSICGRWKERTEGRTEAYIAETELWVCYNCALDIDPDLVRFAYDTSYRPKRKRKCKPEHFGLCPACSQAGNCKNIGSDHWYFCTRHGLKWHVGSNLFSGWRDEIEDDWESNANFLSRFRETKPYFPEPTLFRRIREGVHAFRAKVRLRQRRDISAEEMLIQELGILRPIAERTGKRCIKELIEHAVRNGGRDELEGAKQAFLADKELYVQLPDDIPPF